MKSSRYSSVLGISFNAGGMTAALVHRANGGVCMRQGFREPLSLDLLTSDPDRAGSEIRRLMDQRGIRERRCVVCIPVGWALTKTIEVPVLSKEDVESFLNLQAEREFPFPLDDLILSVSRCRTLDGVERATLVAVPRGHLAALERALLVAKLHPVSITFGIAALLKEEDRAEKGRILLLVNEKDVELAVAFGDSMIALRCLNEAVEGGPENWRFDTNLVVRQIRITLGQFPQSLRDSISRVALFGSSERDRKSVV